MRNARTVLTLAVALLIACPLLAGEKKGPGKKAPPNPVVQRVDRMVEGLTLTDGQKAKLEEVKKEFGPKLAEAVKKTDSVFTAEQRKARGDAAKAAKDAGKKGKELNDAVDASVKLTDEQKAKLAEAEKEAAPVEKELREKVMSILTPEQQEEVKKKAPAGKKAAK